MRCILRSLAIISNNLLWIRISNLAHVAVPWPEGAFKVGTRNLFVGRGIGPFFLIPWLAHTDSICSHTDLSASNWVDDNRMRAFCIVFSPRNFVLKYVLF